MEKVVTRQLLDELFTYENGKFFWKKPPKRHPDLIGKEAGSPQPRNNKIYWAIQIDGKKHKRSRLVYFYVHGKFPEPCVDHINGDSTDDRPENLREASFLQNSWNIKKMSKRLDLPMGVRNTAAGNFAARITYMGKQLHLGAYKTIEKAQQVYMDKRRELYGEFA